MSDFSKLFPPAFQAHELDTTEHAESEIYSVSPEITAKLASHESTAESINSKPLNENKGRKNKQKFSRRIVLGAHTTLMPIVCEATGAVIAATIPVIPDKYFVFRSPFAILTNVHAIAESGFAYLNKLDAQLLSATLITLAAEWDLFSYSPMSSGAHKNAVLRTIRRETLISAILFIHCNINSFRASRIPQLSLNFSEAPTEFELDIRMSLWLKTITDIIFPPAPTVTEAKDALESEFSEEEGEARIQKKITAYTHAKAKAEAKHLRKMFRAFKAQATIDIKLLFTNNKISFKLKNYLLGILSEEILIGSDPAMIELLCTKLDQLNLEMAAKLAISIRSFHRQFTEKNVSEFSTDNAPLFSSMPVGTYASTEPDNEASEFDTPSTDRITESQPIVADTSSKPMSFMEKVRMKRLAKQALPAPTINNTINNTGNIPSAATTDFNTSPTAFLYNPAGEEDAPF